MLHHDVQKLTQKFTGKVIFQKPGHWPRRGRDQNLKPGLAPVPGDTGILTRKVHQKNAFYLKEVGFVHRKQYQKIAKHEVEVETEDLV